jgi:predicted nucleotidyltransferase component of viral defense system
MHTIDTRINNLYRYLMPSKTDAQTIESFHLLFLQVLTSSRQDWFVLKGGANIRYFFGSDRYSNDIDLDIVEREAWWVGEAVDKILDGKALASLVRSSGIGMSVTRPKQTDTTRRWKIQLVRVGETGPGLPTKIEFSARTKFGGPSVLEQVPDTIVRPYGQRAPLVQHYGEVVAIQQKIAALALRSETKARDVFDLELLFRLHYAESSSEPIESEYARQAAQKACSIPYESYRSEVLPFIDSDVLELYESEETWESVRETVVLRLDQMADAMKRGGEK